MFCLGLIFWAGFGVCECFEGSFRVGNGVHLWIGCADRFTHLVVDFAVLHERVLVERLCVGEESNAPYSVLKDENLIEDYLTNQIERAIASKKPFALKKASETPPADPRPKFAECMGRAENRITNYQK